MSSYCGYEAHTCIVCVLHEHFMEGTGLFKLRPIDKTKLILYAQHIFRVCFRNGHFYFPLVKKLKLKIANHHIVLHEFPH